jgi:cell division control protein 6
VRATGAAEFEPPTAASLVARGTRFNPTDPAMVATAKAALHTSAAHVREVLCRERERKTVLDLVRKCLKARRGGSAYVCGLPGTGKSLTVSEAERVARCWGDGSAAGGGSKHAVPKSERPRVAAVNCMALGDPRLVFSKVIEELGGAEKSAAHKNARAFAERDDVDLGADLGALPEVATLRQLVTGGGVDATNDGSSSKSVPTTVILLDEMDQLVSKAQGILYELFGLPTLPGSRCVVIGVANGINLVEVTLPRLAARGCEPNVVRFNAYDNAQLKRLLRQRLGALPFAVFEDAGLELCARKVAAATGDMRRALNICAVAVDLCAREAADLCAANDEERAKETRATSKPEPRFSGALVKVAHVARAVSASFSSPVVDTVRGLPQHQQMVLCAAVRAFRERQSGSGTGSAQSAGSTLGVLNDKYTALCKEAGIRGVTPGEFSGVCTVLADQTLLRVGAGREDRQRKVSLAVHQDDVVFALQGVNFFRNLIGEGRGGNAGTGGRR